MYNYNVYTAMHQLGVTRLRTEQSKVLSCILQNRDVLASAPAAANRSFSSSRLSSTSRDS